MKTQSHHSPLYWLVVFFTGLFILGIMIKVVSFMINPKEGLGPVVDSIGWYLFLPGAAGLLILMLVHAIFQKKME
ncbi:hypothetical protein [Solitalea lacus]|uniref:hypothetical protein n=1 Tax=Solitalea lacus TaxID=2911172 RepID=UPI001EDAE8A2|nr:hypothetical protein [Solitalea lacus]UKJ08994.1 hypothetical protein L2B55_07445 [Solitalea lacus]